VVLSPLGTVFGASQITALFAALAATWSTTRVARQYILQDRLGCFFVSVLLLILSITCASLRHLHHLALNALESSSIRWTFGYEIDRVLEHISTRGLYGSCSLFALGLCAITTAVAG
jgi:hypothetical protein